MSITNVQLNAAKFLVGPNKKRLKGAAEDFFTIATMGDTGTVVQGMQGDVMLVSNIVAAYTATITVQQASQATAVLLSLIGNQFPVAISFNDFSFIGFAVVTNPGEWVAGLATSSRTFTLGMAYVSGNITSGIGETLG